MGVSNFRSLFIRVVFLVFVSASLFGCAVKGTGPIFALQEPKPDEVIVFHYRVPSFVGSGLQYDVLSNGSPVTRIGNGGYFKQVIKPGHTVYEAKVTTRGGPYMLIGAIENALADFIQAYEFNAEAEQLYFLRWTPYLGLGRKPVIEQIPKEEALQQLTGLRSFLPAQTVEN